MSFHARMQSTTRRRTQQTKSRHSRAKPFVELLEGRLMLHSGPGLVAETDEHSMVFGGVDSLGVSHPGLVPLSAVTNTALNSGNWLANKASADPSMPVWSNGVPKVGDNVYIPAGITVTLDGLEGGLNATGSPFGALLRTVRVNGTLNFEPDVNTSLLVDTIVVMPGGTYWMGTQAAPVQFNKQARVVFAQSNIPNRDAWDPLQFSLGLVTHGSVHINGRRPANDNAITAAPSITSFVLGSKDFMHGSTTLDLGTTAVPKDWNVGDSIIVTGLQPSLPYYLGGAIDQDEEVKITAIVGNTIKINTPLQYDHTMGSSYVADVTRNVQFVSADPGVVAHRGHIMFMHNPDVQVEGAGFYGLGRTDKRRPIDDPVIKNDVDNPGQTTTEVLLDNPNPDLIGKTVTLSDGTVITDGKIYANGQIVRHVEHRVLAQIYDPATGKYLLQLARTGLNPRGRYAVHFHRTGDETPVSIDGSAVVDSPGWGIVNHSSNVDVTNNVVFNVVGAAYVTEAGDEVGSFVHNIAIKSLGSGEQVDNRKNIQDFGHDGDGFWLQGGNVSLINNVASGQRHAGFVFFPRGLVQKGFSPPQMQISGADLPAAYGADPTKNYEVMDVPLLKFQGNVAFADATGYESWFTLQKTTLKGRTVLEDFTVFATTGNPIFTPYTSLVTFKNVTLRNPVNWAGTPIGPSYTGFERNDLTADIIYDHVTVTGFNIGINAPVVGTNTIVGGTFNNVQNISVTTTNSDTRVLNINDASPSDPVHFVDSLKTMVNGQLVAMKQYDIYLQANWQPLFNDITRNFARDIIKIGLVSHNGQQVYFKEQAFDYVPYPDASFVANNPGVQHGPIAAAWVPPALLNQTNQQLWDTYGLAIGGVVAPKNAIPDPLINGIVGPATQYPPPNYLWSAKWFDTRKGPYFLIYSYWNPSLNQGKGAYTYISETTPTPLVGGWNVIKRTFSYVSNGQLITQPVSLLVYNEIQDPSFIQANPGQVLNLADVNNGTVFNLSGWISASYGKVQFTATVKLNDPKYVSALKTRADGTQYVTISFSITNFAGTTTQISIDFNVTTTATLIKDMGQKYLPYTDISTTLARLLGFAP